NSGAVAVVEGAGDHCCEYMTGGTIAVLGATGRNFGAGMTNGLAFVYDADGTFPNRINGESVLLEGMTPDNDEASILHKLLARHVKATGSALGSSLLADWDQAL